MKLTIEKAKDLLPSFELTEEEDGIAIYHDAEDGERVVELMRELFSAALDFKLHATQFVDRSEYHFGQRGSTWTGEYGPKGIEFKVKFLYKKAE